MDNFSVQARAVIELGQQSENALSYLDRNTAAEQQARGTSWSRDQTRVGSICQIVVRDTGFNTGEILWRSVGLLVESVGGCKGGLYVISARSGFVDEFAAQYASCLFYNTDGSALAWACRTDSSKFFFPPANFHSSPTPAMLSCTALEESNPCLHSGILTYQDGSGQDFRITGKGGSESHKRREENAPSAGHDYSGATAGCKPTGRSLTCPFVIDGLAEISHAHPQILRLGEKVHLFQPPDAPGGEWVEMQAVTWAIERNPDAQISIKYRVDPRGDREMMEGCPVLKKIAGRKFVPVGIHLGRFTEKEWTHHGLSLISGVHQMVDWSASQTQTKSHIAEARKGGAKTSFRRLMQEKTKDHLHDVVTATVQRHSAPKKGTMGARNLMTLSDEEGEALAEACEERGALAVLTLLGAAEQKAIRRPGLKALARLASDNHPTLLEIGRSGGIEAAIDVLRNLGELQDVRENACWLLALLSQVAEFNRSIGRNGGCEEICKVLRGCAQFGGACPRTQSWALGCVVNLLACAENRLKILGGGEAGAEKRGTWKAEAMRESLASWIHTLFTNSDRVLGDRDAQFSGIACAREIAVAGPDFACKLRATGVPRLVTTALEKFGRNDRRFRDQAASVLQALSRVPIAEHTKDTHSA